MEKVAIVDYGMGNLHSVKKAFEKASPRDEILITRSSVEIDEADKIILPGVGAIKDCIKSLRDLKLDQLIVKNIKTKPLLAICVGMQILLDFSEENNGTKGLGLIKGDVKKFNQDDNSRKIKIPHMGWNTVEQVQDHFIWSGIPNNSYFYFVHSYKFEPNENYGRELLELFSLGVGNYTELDIKNAARAFTGWTFAQSPPLYPHGYYPCEFVFKEEDHDNSGKQFLGHTGNFDGSDVDEGDFLSYHLVIDDLPANGIIVNNDDGTATYTPNPEYNGLDSLRYRVNDQTVYSEDPPSIVLITVIPLDDPPVLDNIDNANFEMHKMEDAKIMIFNKYNGEVEYKKIEGDFIQESLSHYFRNKIVSGSLD